MNREKQYIFKIGICVFFFTRSLSITLIYTQAWLGRFFVGFEIFIYIIFWGFSEKMNILGV